MTGNELIIRVGRENDTIRVTLSGALDLVTTPQLEAAFPSPRPDETACVDLEALVFIDSRGIRALMQLDVTARAEGWSLVLVGAQGHVKRVLELCRVHGRIRMIDDAHNASST